MSVEPVSRWRCWRPALAAALSMSPALAAGPAQATTLFDAIRLAYQTNPVLRGQRAEVNALGEGYVEARAGLGPQLYLSAQGGHSIARVQAGPSLFTGPSDTTYRGSTGTADLSLVQPIYAFGANRAQVRGAEATFLAGTESLRQAEADTLNRVITAYVDVRRDRETLRVLNEEIGTLAKVVDEAQTKGELGALSRTDVAEARGRLLQVQAQFDLAQGRLIADNAEYLNVVGENPDDLAPEPELPTPRNADEAFAAADHNNALIRSALESEAAAREKVNEAKAAYGPTLSMRVDAGVQPIEPYLPNLYDRNVTVAAVLSQPLFTSGLRAAKVREAVDRHSAALLQVEATRRDVVQKVSLAWSQLAATTAAAARVESEVEADSTALEGNQVEERVGRRSIFELLNAELQLANARIDLLQQRHDEYLAKASVLAAMGLLEARYLTPGLETYEPIKAARRARGGASSPWVGLIEGLDRPPGGSVAPLPAAALEAGSKRPDAAAAPPVS